MHELALKTPLRESKLEFSVVYITVLGHQAIDEQLWAITDVNVRVLLYDEGTVLETVPMVHLTKYEAKPVIPQKMHRPHRQKFEQTRTFWKY